MAKLNSTQRTYVANSVKTAKECENAVEFLLGRIAMLGDLVVECFTEDDKEAALYHLDVQLALIYEAEVLIDSAN